MCLSATRLPYDLFPADEERESQVLPGRPEGLGLPRRFEEFELRAAITQASEVSSLEDPIKGFRADRGPERREHMHVAVAFPCICGPSFLPCQNYTYTQYVNISYNPLVELHVGMLSQSREVS